MKKLLIITSEKTLTPAMELYSENVKIGREVTMISYQTSTNKFFMSEQDIAITAIKKSEHVMIFNSGESNIPTGIRNYCVGLSKSFQMIGGDF